MDTAEAHPSAVLSPHYIVVHHTDISASKYQEQLELVNGSHQRRWNLKSPFTGHYIVYHYFIGRDGTVVKTRDESERTGHTLNEEINNDSIAVVLAGDFNSDALEGKQLESARSVIHDLMQRYNIPRNHVIPHQEASPTSCPGKRVIDLLHNH